MLQIGEKPSPTFDDPLGLMSDCHRRVESFLRALIIVTEQANGCPLNEKQREGLQTALRYFSEAAPKHTADEENSLFPRMRALAYEEVEAALKKIDALEADHRVAGAAHETVERIGKRWLEQNQLPQNDVIDLVKQLRLLHGIYERHIAVEDNEIFPLAGKVLPTEQLAEIGREMALRRGQDPDRRITRYNWDL
jgi:hemerythrin-like domain-containing protein